MIQQTQNNEERNPFAQTSLRKKNISSSLISVPTLGFIFPKTKQQQEQRRRSKRIREKNLKQNKNPNTKILCRNFSSEAVKTRDEINRDLLELQLGFRNFSSSSLFLLIHMTPCAEPTSKKLLLKEPKDSKFMSRESLVFQGENQLNFYADQ